MALPKIITVLGARPQFIKSAILSRHIKGIVHEDILHTGQHYDHLMSGALFEQLELQRPTWNLDCSAAKHGAMTAKMLEGIEIILEQQKPNAVLVYGDTNSTLAGALASSKLHIPVWHVESGVRSFNKKMPEEINRIITDRIADVHFATSPIACQNLQNEGINASSIHNVGDIMYDLFLDSVAKEKKVDLPFSSEFLVLTLHRAENFQKNEDIEMLFNGLEAIAAKYPIILPIHPRVEKILQQANFSISSNIFVRAPLDYFEMIYVLNRCLGVLTDSGGLQKEAYYASKPCITIRDETEWVELLGSGWNMLVPPIQLCDNRQRILDFLATNFAKKPKENYYGSGNASQKIKEVIQKIYE